MNIQNLHIPALTALAKTAAIKAGENILEIYHSDEFEVKSKDDQSPLTKADQVAHEVIMEYLGDSGLPILSEEGAHIPYPVRKDWEFYWLVDPLDGTKEFVKKNGEFTVNIALIHLGKPVMGVVYVPVLDCLYWGNADTGAWKQVRTEAPLKLEKVDDATIKTIVCSSSHMNAETEDFIAQYPGAAIIRMGSSLKFMWIAENKAQLYPRFGPTMEWDTAAAHAIVNAMGGEVLTMEKRLQLSYNKENMLNPDFLVRGFRNL